MSMTELDISKAATLRKWVLSACPVDSTMRPARCHAPMAGAEPAALGIELEDWDLLFRAVLETLARVACDRTPPDGTTLRLQTDDEMVGGCLQALDQLRRSRPLVQAPWMFLGSAPAPTVSN